MKKKVIAVVLAYNAEKSLENFYKTFPVDLVDDVIIFDDASTDKTLDVAKRLDLRVCSNKFNLGYGGNLKRALSTCLKEGADIIVDLHADGEYLADAVPLGIAEMEAGADLVLGDRFDSKRGALQGGMFIWKYFPIKFLNFLCAVVLKTSKLDFHTGFRVYSRKLLETANYTNNSNGFIFSFEIIVQCIYHGLRLTKVPVETWYRGQKRGAKLSFCFTYFLKTLRLLLLFLLARCGLRTKYFSRLVDKAVV